MLHGFNLMRSTWGGNLIRNLEGVSRAWVLKPAVCCDSCVMIMTVTAMLINAAVADKNDSDDSVRFRR